MGFTYLPWGTLPDAIRLSEPYELWVDEDVYTRTYLGSVPAESDDGRVHVQFGDGESLLDFVRDLVSSGDNDLIRIADAVLMTLNIAWEQE